MTVDAVSAIPQPPATAIAPAVGEFQGKKVFHWSFYVQVAGALGGIIITIAGLVLGMPALLGPGLFFSACGAIGAFYIHTFSVYSQLDSYVNELQEKLTAAQADLSKQKGLNTDLNNLVTKTQKEMGELQEAGKKSLADWDAREKALKGQVDALEKATKQVEADRKQALADFDKRFNELHAEYIVLETDKKARDAEIVKLNSEVTAYKENNNTLAKELTEFKANYDKYDKENDELKALNGQLQTQVAALTEQIKTFPKVDTKPLEKELNETEIAADKAVDKADDLIKQMEELLKT